MRDYGNPWVDHRGIVRDPVRSGRRLKFKYPLHAAIRAFVFHRDGYKCQRCEAHAVDVPSGYDGHNALWTNTKTGGGFQDVLVVDHVLTLRAGGINHPSNMQALCETCNRRKQKEDKAAIAEFLRAV